MLKLFNNLKPFFEDNYERIHVREYARLMKISPPSASKMLDSLKKEGLLKQEKDKGYILYYANKDERRFILLQRTYWQIKLRDSGLLNELEKEFINPVVILFGSVAKAEISSQSDIDVAVFSHSKKTIMLDAFSKKLGKNIQLFQFKNRASCSKELLSSILNGHILSGSW